jgi:hypothetical protein
MSLSGVRTALNVERGLELLREFIRKDMGFEETDVAEE